MNPLNVPLWRLLDAAADAVGAVLAGRSLTDALARVPVALRPGAQALSFQALRQLGAARVLSDHLVRRAPPARTQALLVTALALLWPGPSEAAYAPHTLVDQAVEAAQRRHAASAGFVNAVLRRFLLERQALVALALRDPEAAHQHPRWWIDRVRADWPHDWAQRLAAAQRQAPMSLRVNRRRCSVADYHQHLAQAGLDVQPLDDPALPDAVVLARGCPVERLPGFDQGWVSVQDLSAQRAAGLLLNASEGLAALAAGARVLDACAAPGGKTAHLLERADHEVWALDSDAMRLDRLQQTLLRLGLSATCRVADAGDVQGWWDGRPFDAILLDAPCTASGIVRRHPDVPWLRRPEDVGALVRTQARLLDALWPLLAPGGRLLYATCSIFRDEGERQIDAFLQRAGPVPARRMPGSPGHLSGLPDNGALESERPTGDGFFYALLSSG